MANYPQLDNTRGVWNIKEIYDAMMGGYWPNASGGRAIYVGGATPSNSDVIDFITMSSVGNATDFGNLTGAKNTFPGVCSSFTRGLIGDASSIDFITYATTGNAAAFAINLKFSAFQEIPAGRVVNSTSNRLGLAPPPISDDLN